MRHLSASEGPLLLDGGQLIVMSRGRVGAAPAGGLATQLWSSRPAAAELMKALGAREPVQVTKAKLASWGRALAQLRGRRDLQALIDEGQRPLRKYRGVDLAARLDTYSQRVEQLGRLFDVLPSAAPCLPGADEPPTAQDLVDSLSLQMSTIAAWDVDPARRLRDRADPEAKSILLDLAADERGRPESALAALLLGCRHSGADRQQKERLLQRLPGEHHALYRVGLTLPRSEPTVLHARCWAAGVSLPRSAVGRTATRQAGRAAERVALVADLELAGAAWTALTRDASSHLGPDAQRRRLDGYVRASRGCPRGRHERRLEQRFAKLPRRTTLRAAALVSLLTEWMGERGVRRAVPRRDLERTARQAFRRGLAFAAERLTEAWRGGLAAPADRQEPDGQRQHTLALVLAMAPYTPPLPANLETKQTVTLLSWLEETTPHVAFEVWPALIDCAVREMPRWLARALWCDGLPAPVRLRAHRLQCLEAAEHLSDAPDALSAYLDFREGPAEHVSDLVDLEEEWLYNLFRLRRGWMPTLVACLASDHDPKLLFDVGQQILAEQPALAAALDEWNTISVHEPPAELEALVHLRLDEDELHKYLHHRRLLGHGETFARALLEPLEVQRETDGQIGRLQEILSGIDAPGGPRRATLEQRLVTLRDPARLEARIQAARSRAENRLARSLALLEKESLAVCLDRVARTALESFLGRSLPDQQLTKRLRDALHLVHASYVSMPLFREFMEGVLRGDNLVERSENQRWLTRARRHKTNTEAWLRGIDVEVELAGERYRLKTEDDPLHVLRMGSYFSTCLTLESGMNAASTLVNAMDVNKHVIYGYREDGAVVMRKLIGATAKGELVGYETYGARTIPGSRGTLTGVIGRFAANCGLTLSDEATPETLHDSFWYDDGTEAWDNTPIRQPSPGEAPPGERARLDWAVQHAAEIGDLAALRALSRVDFCDIAAQAARQLVRLDPEGPWPGGDDGPGLRADHLAAHGDVTWVHRARALDIEPVPILMAAAPGFLPERSGALLNALGRAHAEDLEAHIPSGALAMAPTAALVAALRPLAAARDRDDGTSAGWRGAMDLWSQILQVAWLRDGDSSALARCAAAGGSAATVVAMLATRHRVPRLAPVLRKELRRRAHPFELALALGTQGERGDAPTLLRMLHRWPERIELALAVKRCGDEEQVATALLRWTPSTQGLQKKTDVWRSRARELGSPRMTQRLLRHLSRALASGDDPQAWLRHLAVLAPGDLTSGELRERLEATPWYDATQHERACQTNLALARSERLLLARRPLPEDLLDLVEGNGFPSFFDRLIYALATEPDAGRRAEILSPRARRLPPLAGHAGSLLMGAIGADGRDRLPWETREQLAPSASSSGLVSGGASWRWWMAGADRRRSARMLGRIVAGELWSLQPEATLALESLSPVEDVLPEVLEGLVPLEREQSNIGLCLARLFLCRLPPAEGRDMAHALLTRHRIPLDLRVAVLGLVGEHLPLKRAIARAAEEHERDALRRAISDDDTEGAWIRANLLA